VRRLLPHPALSALLLIVWLLLADGSGGGVVAIGIALAIALPIYTAPFWPDRPRLHFGGALLGYLAVVGWDILVANFQVARLVLFRRNRELRPRWLVIPIDLPGPEAVTVLAGTISLTPGTVTADIAADGRHLLVHALDVADAPAEIARIKARYEARLQRVFA
jgi:multicomponent K+:H+ antiporter subunit E